MAEEEEHRNPVGENGEEEENGENGNVDSGETLPSEFKEFFEKAMKDALEPLMHRMSQQTEEFGQQSQQLQQMSTIVAHLYGQMNPPRPVGGTSVFPPGMSTPRGPVVRQPGTIPPPFFGTSPVRVPQPASGFGFIGPPRAQIHPSGVDGDVQGQPLDPNIPPEFAGLNRSHFDSDFTFMLHKQKVIQMILWDSERSSAHKDYARKEMQGLDLAVAYQDQEKKLDDKIEERVEAAQGEIEDEAQERVPVPTMGEKDTYSYKDSKAVSEMARREDLKVENDPTGTKLRTALRSLKAHIEENHFSEKASYDLLIKLLPQEIKASVEASRDDDDPLSIIWMSIQDTQFGSISSKTTQEQLDKLLNTPPKMLSLVLKEVPRLHTQLNISLPKKDRIQVAQSGAIRDLLILVDRFYPFHSSIIRSTYQRKKDMAEKEREKARSLNPDLSTRGISVANVTENGQKSEIFHPVHTLTKIISTHCAKINATPKTGQSIHVQEAAVANEKETPQKKGEELVSKGAIEKIVANAVTQIMDKNKKGPTHTNRSMPKGCFLCGSNHGYRNCPHYPGVRYDLKKPPCETCGGFHTTECKLAAIQKRRKEAAGAQDKSPETPTPSNRDPPPPTVPNPNR